MSHSLNSFRRPDKGGMHMLYRTMSKYPNTGALGPKYDSDYRIWAQRPISWALGPLGYGVSQKLQAYVGLLGAPS